MRNFLFLQGPVGPFFSELGAKLTAQGHRVLRIQFNNGDCFHWSKGDTTDFTHPIRQWEDFVRNTARFRHITDLVVYGDRRPLHRIAIDTLKPLGVRIHVLEEGYLRPHWITLERNGVNASSSLPRQPDFYYKQPAMDEPDFKDTGNSLIPMCLYAIGYYLTGLLRRHSRFEHYQHHYHTSNMIMQWVTRLSTLPWRKLEACYKRLRLRGKYFFLVPLQIDRDMQVTDHSHFSCVADFADQVIASFAQHAPAHAVLVLKNHPLASGASQLRQHVRNAAQRHGITQRVVFIPAGRLPWLLSYTSGVITINSTAGLSAIHHHCPVIVMGNAIYNMEGLTYQQSLDAFWNKPTPPNYDLYLRFRSYLLHHTQINGSFYSRRGRNLLLTSIPKALIQQVRPVSNMQTY